MRPGPFFLAAAFGLGWTAVVLSPAGTFAARLPGLGERLAGGLEQVLAGAGFGLERISVTGHNMTDEAGIFAALVPDGRKPVWVGPAALARLERLPWVAEARARRVSPNALSIEIRERRAFAVWRHDGTEDLVDETGRVLAPVRAGLVQGLLPRLAGEGAPGAAPAFLALLGRYPALAARTEMLERAGGRRWTLHLAGGGLVHLPPEREAAALSELAAREALLFRLPRENLVIDMRARRWITVRSGSPAPAGPKPAAGS